MHCKFKDVTEKDMDMLILEELVAEQSFANLFLQQVNKSGAEVISVEHSKSDVELGESDITVIVEWHGKRHALLIEDKIDAVAMENQCDRYFKRGDKAVTAGEYEGYDVFIIAPKKYLEENEEALKYPSQVSYEECFEYFAEKGDNRSLFKMQQIEMAIENQKHGYQVKENIAVTRFWNGYIDYQEKYFAQLGLVSSKGAKGSNATWAHYKIKGWSIPHQMFHKMEKGCVDLTFYGAKKKVDILEKELEKYIPDWKQKSITVECTGSSACLRTKVSRIDVLQPIDDQMETLKECFETLCKMNDIAREMDEDWLKEVLYG